MQQRARRHLFPGATLLLLLVACGAGGASSSGLLDLGASSSCRSTCARQATDCTSYCNLACEGFCSGSMPASDFPYVDSVQCMNGFVTFHKGGSTLTCTL